MSSYIDVKIVCDSVNETTGDRITTFLLEYPRIILAEMLTHRLFSRNTASSRAVPVDRMLERLTQKSYSPEVWGKNQKGMQASESVSEDLGHIADIYWDAARDSAIRNSEQLRKLGVHKQIANRLTEPFQIIQCVVTATQYKNFFKLRNHPAAQPEIRELADKMQFYYNNHDPKVLSVGEWHMPFAENESYALETLKQISVARCARASYYIKEEQGFDIQKDLDLAEKLMTSGHLSPFEHVAVALPERVMCGNFVGWLQHRKFFENESNGDLEDVRMVTAKEAIKLLVPPN